jgi:hypothetical protein
LADLGSGFLSIIFCLGIVGLLTKNESVRGKERASSIDLQELFAAAAVPLLACGPAAMLGRLPALAMAGISRLRFDPGNGAHRRFAAGANFCTGCN